jgi:DNA polymerase-3 subunit epsilon
MREIVLDTETTGLDFNRGHRVIEIGCVEIFNRIPTGREFHCFINPERDVPAEAEAVHGLTTEFLAGKPLFREIMHEFLAFIGDDPVVAHNAQFDATFLNHELEQAGATPIALARVVDTLAIARRKHPAGPNTLDALCKRYGIDASIRTKHGALVDSLLLAQVYVELLGERQAALVLQTMDARAQTNAGIQAGGRRAARQRPAPLPSRLSEGDIALHRRFIGMLGAKALWLKFWNVAAE